MRGRLPRFTWSASKRLANLAKHGVDFDEVGEFDFAAALVKADARFDYVEPRMIAIAPIRRRLYVLVFSVEARTVRVISLRKANRKEFDRYESGA